MGKRKPPRIKAVTSTGSTASLEQLEPEASILFSAHATGFNHWYRPPFFPEDAHDLRDVPQARDRGGHASAATSGLGHLEATEEPGVDTFSDDDLHLLDTDFRRGDRDTGTTGNRNISTTAQIASV